MYRMTIAAIALALTAACGLELPADMIGNWTGDYAMTGRVWYGEDSPCHGRAAFELRLDGIGSGELGSGEGTCAENGRPVRTSFPVDVEWAVDGASVELELTRLSGFGRNRLPCETIALKGEFTPPNHDKLDLAGTCAEGRVEITIQGLRLYS